MALWIIATATGSYGAGAQSPSTAAAAQKQSFEVATVRPSRPDSTNEDWDGEGDRVTIKGYSLRKLIKAAYNLKSDAQIVGGPDWLDKQRFDISAKIGNEKMPASAAGDDRGEETRIQTMMQSLLDERFHLRAEYGQRSLPVFKLVVSGNKTRLVPDSTKPRSLSIRNGHMVAIATSMSGIADGLTRMKEVGDRMVIDQSGLAGTYDLDLNWTPDRGAGVSEQAVYPGLFTALQEQLGLKLKPGNSEVQVIEVRAAELPSFD